MGVKLFVEYLAEVRPIIDQKLREYLAVTPEGTPLHTYLYGILDEFIARGGKRIRPAMAMMACEAVGGDPLRALPSGCAVEFFHAAALIHDDIMDGSELRRDERCAHIVHGVPLAINTGDFALGLVCTIVVRDEGLDDRTKIAVLDAIGEMSARTIEGQALDVGWVRDDVYDLEPDDYLFMALGKTGYYSGISPLKIGALIGGATPAERQALEHFGKNSAIAFQIQDDLLNIVGDEAVTGKDYLNDILESKRTLMVIHCLEAARGRDRERLAELLRLGPVKSAEEVQEVVEMLYRYESINYARNLARGLILEARSYLSALPKSRAKEVLASMADYFLEREN
ncbi:MAG: short chain isoprenyl diphosphate synthase IdsA [Thermoleophilia bacterium]